MSRMKLFAGCLFGAVVVALGSYVVTRMTIAHALAPTPEHYGAISPYGPAGSCDAGAGVVCGTFPGGLHLASVGEEAGTVYQALGDGGVGWRQASPLPTASQLAYVSLAGNDNNVGTIERPWRTIQHAVNMTSNLPGYYNTVILLAPGSYVENVQLLPDVIIGSSDPGGGWNDENVIVSGTLTLSPSWPSNTTGIVGLQNITWSGAITIDGSIPKATGGSANFVVYQSWLGESTTTLKNLNYAAFVQSIAASEGPLTLEGVSLFKSYSSHFYEHPVFASSPNTGYDAGNITTTWYDYGSVFEESPTIQGLVNPAEFAPNGSLFAAPIILSGTHEQCNGVFGSYVSTTFTNGATTPCTFGQTAPSNTVTYAAAVPSNWATSPPTTVNVALDRIAANTGNSHPIP